MCRKFGVKNNILKKILIIQTAFIGDVILATPLIEKLHQYYPDAQIDFLLRKGNEGLLRAHPYLNNVIIWDKKKNKLLHLWHILNQIRKNRYDTVINLQRFLSTGLLTAFSKGKEKIGFNKNPMSFLFTKKVVHLLSHDKTNPHEVVRNLSLIAHLTDNTFIKPKLHPSIADDTAIKPHIEKPYICIAPASVWFTKQYPLNKWIEFINAINTPLNIIILGSKSDLRFSEEIIDGSTNAHITFQNLCGQLSLLESAALLQEATMNFVNDSAPLHLCSAVNAPTAAIFCATVPSFGFGPLSDKSFIVETEENLRCRPCSNHGKKNCPEKHFKCAQNIDVNILINILNKSFIFS